MWFVAVILGGISAVIGLAIITETAHAISKWLKARKK